MMRLLSLILFVSLCCSISGFAQAGQDMSLKNVSEYIQLYNQLYHKQKVHLHLDKDTYFANDVIWFKAYVNCGYKNNLDSVSDNLYVELWDPTGYRINIVRLKLDNGLAQGHLALADTLKQGIYQVRAFTDMMLNFPVESYFSKNLPIYNNGHKYQISKTEARKNRTLLKKIQKQKSKIKIIVNQDGRLIDGVENTIYYQIVNEFGEPVMAKVALYESGKRALLINKGLPSSYGKYVFTPHTGNKYKLEFMGENGKKYSYFFQEPRKEGILGDVLLEKDALKLSLSKPYVKSNDPTANRYFVLGHHNNMIYYTGVVDLRSDTLIVLQRDMFPRGIVNFSVLSSRLVQEAQYSCFSQPKATQAVSVSQDLLNDTLSIFCSIDKSINNLSSASLSVSLDEKPLNTYLGFERSYYFDSDVKGSFADSLISNENKLEYVAKVAITIEPDWNRVFSDSIKILAPVPENKIVLRGRILSEILDIPIKNASVSLEVSDRYNDIYSAVTDDKGYFGFEGFDFYDTLDMKLIARKKSGRKGVLIEFEEFNSPVIEEYYGDFFLTVKSERDKKEYRKITGIKAAEKAKKEEIEAYKFYSQVIHGRPDFILHSEDVLDNYSALNAIKGRVPGVVVTGNQILIRGVKSLVGSNEPLVLVDDVPTDVWVLDNIWMRDIDRIEFLKGSSASIYGLRGGNGVIAVYTKRGYYMLKGEIDFSLTGYQKPERFSFKIGEKDLPQTLLWLPEYRTLELQRFDIPLSGYNVTGKYLNIVFEGVDNKGIPVTQTFSFNL